MHLASRALAALVLALAFLGGALPSGVPTTAAAEWTGRYSVYTPRAFSFQHLDYTCVGATVQMMLNMIDGRTDHSPSVQKTYWRYGRDHNRYGGSGIGGVDPDGWVAALERFGAGEYSISLATRYQAGLRALAAKMRVAAKPIGLFVHRGAHAWVMTGFEATADPLASDSYRVTAVEVAGPLYPDGTIGGKSYDPGPRTWLSVDKLRTKFTTFRWSRAPEWSGRWVAVVPD